MEGYRIPIAFVIFNRPDTTEKVFAEIKKVKPAKLYLISDAARKDKEGEQEKVEACRKLVEEGIDWECELHKNYAEQNMGCKERMASGITWFFEHVDMGVILEDDIVPSPDFFPYMEIMLTKYKNVRRVMMVTGTNLMKKSPFTMPYTFSCFPSVWGWGSWKRAWRFYDKEIVDWPVIRANGDFKKVQNGLAYRFLVQDMNRVYYHQKDTWDHQWDFARFKHRGLGIIPRENLVNNIGFDRADATHTTGATQEDFSYGTTMNMEELKAYETEVFRDVIYDKAYIIKNFGMGKVMNFIKKKLTGKK
ncbi:MAG: hypothetical protein MJ105_00470 [Lachnospiraceae bacterium]|nr:hypothetical protein [Lachnospiraceae bacterium]